jgi:outer membrane protein assembly factor BamB
MNHSTRTLTTLATLIATAATGLAGDWPQWRGPAYDGISKETDWNPAAAGEKKVVWEAKVGAGYSAVAVAGGKLYTAGNFNKDTDRISCLDAQSGKEVWKYEYPEALAPKFYSGGCSATPTVHGGKVYFASKSGKVFCLDAATGKEVWKKEFGKKAPTWGFSSSGLIHGKTVIFNAGANGVAYDLETGADVWTSANDSCGYATPVPYTHGGKTCLALFAKNTLTAVGAADGKPLWSIEWQTEHDVNAADPVVSGTQAFITSGYGRGCALVDFSGKQPKKLWEHKDMRSHMSGPVLIDGYLYGFDDMKLVCLDWKTGEKKWEEKSPKKGALMAAGDKLIILGESGRLAIAKATPKGYEEIAGAKVVGGRCWTMPILANGLIYARNSDGDLVAVDVRK